MKLKRAVEGFLSDVDKKLEQVENEAQSRVEDLISKLQTDLDRSEREIDMKRDRLHDEVESRNYDIEVKR